MAARDCNNGGKDRLHGIGVPWFDCRARPANESVPFSLRADEVTVEEGPEDEDGARTACVLNGFFAAVED